MTELQAMEAQRPPVQDCGELIHQLTSADWRNTFLERAAAKSDSRAQAWNKLYGGSPELSVAMENVLQPEKIGNCYLEASIAAVAHYNPASIEQCIDVNRDGTYSVRFTGDKTVYRVDPKDLKHVPFGHENNLWPYVLNHAYGQARMRQDGQQFYPDPEEYTSGREKDHNEIIHMLTGLTPREILSDESSLEKMHKVLSDIKDRNLPATTGTGARIDGLIVLPENLERRHAYAIADYDKAHRVVTLYNPHGGKVLLPLSQFKQYFVGIATVQ